MHELSLAQALLELCLQRLTADQRLATVRIAVGELASVEPDLLRFAWQAVTAGSAHEGAELTITWHAAQQHCTSCGEIAARQPGSWLRLCPECRQPLVVRGGEQLDLLAVTATPASVPALS